MTEYLIKKIVDLVNIVLECFHRDELKEINKNINVKLLIKVYKGNNYSDSFLKTRFLDSPYLEMERMIPKKGTILDLGCGEGLFSNFLALSSSERRVLGIDIDKRRLEQANKGFKNIKFVHGDVTKEKMGKADTIIMFHLLHHLKSYKAQEDFIKEYTDKLRKNGKLFIVEVEPKYSYKYSLAFMVDHFLVPWIFEKRFYSPIFFRSSNEWKEILKGLGFSCKIIPAEKGKPFSHVILKCKRN